MLVGSSIADRTWRRDVGAQNYATSCAAQQRRIYREWGLGSFPMVKYKQMMPFHAEARALGA